MRGRPLEGHRGTATSVCMTLVEGAPVAISGGEDGMLRFCDLTTPRSRGGPRWATEIE